MPDVPRCAALYQHLLGTASTLKYFLINHIPADRFRHTFAASFRILLAIPSESWQKNRCPGFSLVSITVARSCEEVRRRRRSWHRALALDILPRFVTVIDVPETRRCCGQRGGGDDKEAGVHVSTRTDG